jgi:CHAT domain-containing protein/uncharacterized protein HemY
MILVAIIGSGCLALIADYQAFDGITFPWDQRRIAAEKAFDEGERLRWQLNPALRRDAIRKYEDALEYWKSIGEKRAEIAINLSIGEVYFEIAEVQKSLEHFNKAIALSSEAEDTWGEGTALNKAATAQVFQGNSHKSFELSMKALNLGNNINDHKIKAEALYNLGLTYNFWGDKQKSLSFYFESLPLWKSWEDRRGKAKTLMRIGLAYSDLSETENALGYFNQSLDIWRDLDSRREEGQVLTAIARLYSKLDRKQDALNLYNHSKDISHQSGDRLGEAMILNGLGYVYSEMGEKQKALEYYNNALRLYQAANIRNAEGGQLLKIGEIYFNLGDTDKALSYYQQALPIIRSAGDSRFESSALRYLGMLSESQRKYQEAINYYNQALSISQAGRDRRQEAYLLNDIGQIHEKRGKWQKALDCFDKALPLNIAADDRQGQSLTIYNIARTERRRGNFEASRSRINDSLNIIESLRAKVSSQDLRTSYFASIHRRYEFYIDLLMEENKRRPSDNFSAIALETSERARSRTFLELLPEVRANIRNGIPRNLLEQEQSLQRLLNDKAERQTRLLESKHTNEDIEKIAKEIKHLATRYDQVKAQIRSKSPHYAALTQPQPASLKEIQGLLDDDTLLLEYALGEEHSYLWAVTPTRLKSYELPRRAEIEKAARPLYDLLSPPDGSVSLPEKQREAEHWRLARKLSDLILKPVAKELGNNRLLIVADGVLQYIPLGALPIPTDRSGKASHPRTPGYVPLVAEHEIVYLPSASTLAVLRRETANRQPAPKAVAVLANPVFDAEDKRVLQALGKLPNAPAEQVASNDPIVSPGLTRGGGSLARLPGTMREARAIEAMTALAERLVATGFEANRNLATSPTLSQYRIIHFATHGILDRDNPELSAIVLSLVDRQGRRQDGYLRLHDIYNLNLPAELVVLSACDTGLGKEFKGEGLVGLTRGFMYAGASRVMASLWKVEDEPTGKLMEYFYQAMLKERLPAAAALRKAQIELQKDERWRAPYYWAAFTLQGEWR